MTTMPEKRIESENSKSASSKCHCCPYGFHIDRDFVRFCDSLYNNGGLTKLRQHKRERRKNKSLESYLGLNASLDLDKSKKVNDVRNPSTILTCDLYLHNDGLQNAVIDFEDVWQKSLKKNTFHHSLFEKNNNEPLISNSKSSKSQLIKENSIPIIAKDNINQSTNDSFNLCSRSSSASSLSSRSTTTSNIGIQIPSLSEQMSAAIVTLSQAGTSLSHCNTVGIHRTVLTHIRNQIATSLTYMKELEEKVKSIPVLQIKLSALKEEKNSLMLQLQSKSQPLKQIIPLERELEKKLNKLENQGIISPTLAKKSLDFKSSNEKFSSKSSSFESPTMKKCIINNKNISHLKLEDYHNLNLYGKKNTKNVATSCSVLTRDIGTGYVPNKSKSIGVGNDIATIVNLCTYCNKKYYLEHITSVSSESLESDSDSPESPLGQSNHSFSPNRTINLTFENISTILPTKNLVDSCVGTEVNFCQKSINTDLMLQDVISRSEIELKKKYLYKNKSTSMSTVFNNKSVQTFDKLFYRDIGLQTDKIKPKILTCNSFNNMAVGDFDVKDLFCTKCSNLKTKSIGIGNININKVNCESCLSRKKTASIACGEASIYDIVCDKCALRQTETIGIGEFDVNLLTCNYCIKLMSDIENKTDRCSIGTNTYADPSNNMSNFTANMHICDKCSATIQSVAQDLAGNSNEPKTSNVNAFLSNKISQSTFNQLPFNFIKQKNNSDNSLKIYEKYKQNEPLTDRKPITRLENHPKVNEIDESIENIKNASSSNILDLQAPERKKAELSKELKAACKVLNDYLQKAEQGFEKKTISSLNIIQNEWSKIANQKNAHPLLIEDYLDAFEGFSKLLLQRIVNLSDNNGNTALHYAVSYGNFDVVSILIDSKVCDVNKQNKAGYTSIMLVALAEMKNDAHCYVVQRLFSIGDINIKAKQNGQTALMLAASHGKKEMVKMLLDVGAEVNIQDEDGSTALMCAAEHGHLDIVELLLSHPDCDPTIVDNDGCTALTIAMEAGHRDIGLKLYANMNFSRGSSPYSSLKTRKRSTPRSTPPCWTPTLYATPLPSPSARSTSSIPSSFHFPN